VEDVPHEWVFERVKAAVHHGGAGNTAASLRAGIPTVVVPFFADQPFWEWRVTELGVGPEPFAHGRVVGLVLYRILRLIDRLRLGLGLELLRHFGLRLHSRLISRLLDAVLLANVPPFSSPPLLDHPHKSI
jgi:hypothetical protein